MKKLLFGLLTLLWVQSYAQHGNFTQKVFFSDFTDADKPLWPIKNNAGFNFAIENGNYIIECLDENKKAFAPLKWDKKPVDYKAEVNIRMEKGTDGSVGFAFGIQGKLESGYVLQFDKGKKFRVKVIEGINLKNLTGDKKDDGWMECKKLNKLGKSNKLIVYQEKGTVEIFINEQSVFTFHNRQKDLAGGFGFMLDGRVRAVVEDFTVYIPGAAKFDSITYKALAAQGKLNPDTGSKHGKSMAGAKKEIEKAPIKPETKDKKEVATIKDTKSEKKEVVPKSDKKDLPKPEDKKVADKPKENPKKVEENKALTEKKEAASPIDKPKAVVAEKPKEKEAPSDKKTEYYTDSSKDLATLSVAIGEYRKKNLQLTTDYNNCSAELRQVKMKTLELQAFINKNLDVKLKSEMDELRNKNEILSKENLDLKDENGNLKKLQENITKAKDGDIIVVLSENLKKEQKKNEELNKKIKEIEDKLKAKNAPPKPKPEVKPKPEAPKTEAKPEVKPEAKPKADPKTEIKK